MSWVADTKQIKKPIKAIIKGEFAGEKRLIVAISNIRDICVSNIHPFLLPSPGMFILSRNGAHKYLKVYGRAISVKKAIFCVLMPLSLYHSNKDDAVSIKGSPEA